MQSSHRSLRAIPGVDRLLVSEELAALVAEHGREVVVRSTRAVLDELRAGIAAGSVEDVALAPPAIVRLVAAELAERIRPYYRRVINATGVVLHTNLGRAPLAESAVAALCSHAGASQRLEVDLGSGRRGGRDAGCAELLRELTGAEAATVVNNNAAAMLLVLAALGRGRRVVLSRGELVEIGGSFRVPAILEESGCLLHEVGTTNRTHLFDYRGAIEEAIDPPPGMLLKVHTSNYRIEGYTAEVEIEALVGLGAELAIPVVHDLGSGCLVDLANRGLPHEPLVARSVSAGADVVCFSGDKLLGGPQSGILVGRREAIERCRRHPLYRAMRPGRLVYTALEATLRLYRRGEEAAIAAIPVLARLTEPLLAVQARGATLASQLSGLPGVIVEEVACWSQAGSGSMPGHQIASRGVRLRIAGRATEDVAVALRSGDPSVVARIHDDGLVFDARTLSDLEVVEVVSRLRSIVAGDGAPTPTPATAPAAPRRGGSAPPAAPRRR